MSSAHAQLPSDSGFAPFGLDSKLMTGLETAGFTNPRPIQVETIPAALEGRDVLGLAQTGTGKTAAFALPILQRLLDEPGRGPFVLVLAPTRELAIQIDEEFRTLARATTIKTVTIFGGVSPITQIRALRRDPEIVVGCPGRVLDLLNQGKLDLSQIDTLVLDEADHMFDMGFLPDIRKILSRLDSNRQNLLFSATMPKAIRGLADKILDRPHVVELAHTAPAERIEHALLPVAAGRKRALLDRVLAEDDCQTAIVFTRTKHRARRMAEQLSRSGKRAAALQGNMSQAQRDRAMSGFRGGKVDILVATDIAARGLDVEGVDYVINFDPPSTPETYTHRIGRTGRSEASGKALTFVTNEDRGWIRDTERVLGMPLERRGFEGFDAGDPSDIEGDSKGSRDRRGRTNGRANGSGRGRARNGSGRGDRNASARGKGSGKADKEPARSGSGRSRSRGGRGRSSNSAPTAP